MICSVIIPTIGRNTLEKAVASVLDQDFPPGEVEIIIVNDSGQPLPEEPWQQSGQVTLLTTNRRERCFARNTGAAVAQGTYLIFLDDDDWLLPDALGHLSALAQQSPDAVWLYGGIQVVDETGRCLAELNSGLSGNSFGPIMGGAWAPIQSSMIKADAFFAVGGYNPAIIVTEDLDLCRRLALVGDFANTEFAIGCLLRGNTWDTSTNYLKAPEDTLRSREAVLKQPGAFKRLASSTQEGYWFGRNLRVYLSLVRFHLRQKRYFPALSRGLACLGCCLIAGHRMLTSSFWDGVKADHPPDTLHFIMMDLERQASS
ncbi:MAG: glycosyltransferase [Anaerolineae bacterium]|nr:glycosyltransferase [Anaerolineae bacterium]